MIPHGRRIVTAAQYSAETGLPVSDIKKLIDERDVHSYGSHARAAVYDYPQLEAARAGDEVLPDLPDEQPMDLLTVADIASLAGQPANTWVVYRTRNIGAMKDREPDWVEPKAEAKTAAGKPRPPIEFWYRSTAREIVDGLGPRGWRKGTPRPTSHGRPPAPELRDVVLLLRKDPDLTGAAIAEKLGLSERKGQRLRAQALEKHLGNADPNKTS